MFLARPNYFFLQPLKWIGSLGFLVCLVLFLVLEMCAIGRAATVAYWTLDESTGDFVDIVGGNNMENLGGTLNAIDPPAIPNQIPVDSRSSNPGSQTALRGKGPHIPAVDLSTNAWTLEGFIRPGDTNRTFLASNNPNGTANLGRWDLEHNWIGGSAGLLSFRIQDINGFANIITSTSIIPNDGNFYHFAVTWDPSGGMAGSGQITLFINGVESGTGNGSGDQGATSGNTQFYAGGFLLSNGLFHTSLNSTGEMDELRISNTVLTPEQFIIGNEQEFNGDYDGDGTVDGADFLLWQRIDGTPAGLSAWESNYGASFPLSGVSAVPEPTIACLAWTLLTSFLFARRARRDDHRSGRQR